MEHKKGDSREQIILFPECIDDYIEEDNPVRFLDAFVDSLDLKKLHFKHAKTKATGRPPYDPADMLKLYIYGYLNRIRSSRRLETETRRNVELMWLLKRLTPDFKTIADFRKSNLKPLKETVREFNLLCRKLGLFGGELVAIDGSKFAASNSRKRNFTQAKLKRAIREIDKKIDGYIEELGDNDRREEKSPPPRNLKKKIDLLKKGRGKYQKLVDELEGSGKSEVSLTDPDARAMMNAQRVTPSYNAQATVDAKHKLILDYELINNAADQNSLSQMAIRAKKLLGVPALEVLGDKGYYNPGQIKECIDKGITPLIPRPEMKGARDGRFPKERFKYDRVSDSYTCPAGKKLGFAYQTTTMRDKVIRLYKTGSCPGCHLQEKCSINPKGRTINRWEHEELLEEMQTRVKENADKVRTRQWLSEHPFGTIKRSFNQGYMLLKGLDKVNTEFGLTVLAYNIKRAINIVGVKGLITALG